MYCHLIFFDLVSKGSRSIILKNFFDENMKQVSRTTQSAHPDSTHGSGRFYTPGIDF